MKTIALVALAAAAVALPASLTTQPAEAGWYGDARYVPAVYCTYKSKAWVEKGIVSCPDPFMPIGFPGTKWKTNHGATLCWNTYGAAGKDYTGYWAPCGR